MRFPGRIAITSLMLAGVLAHAYAEVLPASPAVDDVAWRILKETAPPSTFAAPSRSRRPAGGALRRRSGSTRLSRQSSLCRRPSSRSTPSGKSVPTPATNRMTLRRRPSRAELIAIEKSAPGERAFAEAFAAWEQAASLARAPY